jgi:5-carboxymethyl-2-hydroxymuconate isomerase
MPHITIECSSNVVPKLDVARLVEDVHEAALSTGIFPVGGTRTRFVERTQYRIADGHPENGFVHVVLRIGAGRDLETKRRAGTAVFDALCAFLQPLYDRMPLGISMEVQEIDPDLNFKKNNLHEYVKERSAAGV